MGEDDGEQEGGGGVSIDEEGWSTEDEFESVEVSSEEAELRSGSADECANL